MTNTWMIRSGEGGYLLDDFINSNIIALGWNEINFVKPELSKENLKLEFSKAYPDWSQGKINQCAGQLYRFIFEVKIGDNVVTYDSSSREYYLGKISSDYKFDDHAEYFHLREVDWEDFPVYRDDLSVETRNTLGSILTIFQLPENVHDELVESSPAYTSEEEQEEAIKMMEEFERNEELLALEKLKDEAISKSLEFTKDLISSLSWENTEKLVGGLLRSMGYKTRFTSRGSDLGSDIVASPDVLALEEPRIKVEVKKRSKDKISSDNLRNFIGGMRDYNKGIYVTTTGFTKEAKYEAERANFPITLIDSDWLVELVHENYDRLEPEIQALIPLKRIYWPI